MSAGRRAPAPWLLTPLLAIAYLIAAPPSSDLAAASYRSWLFATRGFTLWDDAWYGGHHLPAYSLLAPALGALLGPQLVAALSMSAAAWLFALLVRGRFSPRAERLATLWFAWGAAVSLLSNRVPFDLGLAIGLGALVAAARGARLRAAALALVCCAASPVAGAFLALALLAWAIAGPGRWWPLALTALALAPAALLALVFPEGGTQPFDASAFLPALAGTLAIGALTRPGDRPLRIGIALYAVALTGSYVLHTPVGGNAERLGALAGGPVAALLVARAGTLRWQRLALAALALPLLYWQANAPVSDFAAAVSDPGTSAAYYRPLLGELRRLGVGFGARPVRVEVVPLTDHWEARWTAPAVMLARGWERQLDTLYNGVFYDSSTPLTAVSYHSWLVREGVSLVALPDAALDYSAVQEGRLLRGGTPGGSPAGGEPPAYLREIWRSAHWRLFAVEDPTPLARPPARLLAAGHESFSVAVPRAGLYLARMRFSPYWRADAGACVQRAPEGWTAVRARRAGIVRVRIAFSLDRVFARGPRCG